MDILEIKLSVVGSNEASNSFNEMYSKSTHWFTNGARWKQDIDTSGSGLVTVDGGKVPLSINLFEDFEKRVWESDAIVMLLDPSDQEAFEKLSSKYSSCQKQIQPPQHLVLHGSKPSTGTVSSFYLFNALQCTDPRSGYLGCNKENQCMGNPTKFRCWRDCENDLPTCCSRLKVHFSSKIPTHWFQELPQLKEPSTKKFKLSFLASRKISFCRYLKTLKKTTMSKRRKPIWLLCYT